MEPQGSLIQLAWQTTSPQTPLPPPPLSPSVEVMGTHHRTQLLCECW